MNRVMLMFVAVLALCRIGAFRADILEAATAGDAVPTSVSEALHAKDVGRLRKAIAAHRTQVNELMNGELPLGHAVVDRNLHAVEVLLSGGADPNKKDGRGLSAMDLASELPAHKGDVVSAMRNKLVRAGGALSLANAVQIDDLDMVRRLLRKNPKSVNSAGPYGHSPLFTAVSTKNLEAARLLLKSGADPNQHKNDDFSVLQMAMRLSEPGMVALLVKYGADVRQADRYGLSPLYYALIMGYSSIARLLMGKDPRLTLNEATAMRDLRKVLQIIASGSQKPQACGARCPTPLHTAAMNGDLSIAQVLIEAGFDVNATSFRPVRGPGQYKPDATPLRIAAERGEGKMVQLLLAYAADPNKGSALHAAVSGGRVAMVKALIAAEADVNAWGSVGFAEKVTPLYLAAESGNTEIASLLLSAGAEPDKGSTDTGGVSGFGRWNNEGLTPLHAAARRQDINTARLLLDGGADIDARNAAGSTALDMAAFSDEDSPVAKFLKERGAKE